MKAFCETKLRQHLKKLLAPFAAIMLFLLLAAPSVPAQQPGSNQQGEGLEREAEPGLPANCKSADYMQDGDVVTQKGKTYSSTRGDVIESVICVKNGGWLTLVSPKITKTRGGKEDSDYGGQGVEASEASVVNIIDAEIYTDTEGGNGLWATNEGSLIYMRGGSITTTRSAGHGVDTTKRASVILYDVKIDTAGDIGSGALVNDSGDGTVYVNHVTARTKGYGSPGFYMIGERSMLTIKNSSIMAEGSDVGVLVYGANATVTNTDLTGRLGVKVAGGSFTITGGSLTTTGGDAFYITTGEDGPNGNNQGGTGGAPGGAMGGGMPQGQMPEGMGQGGQMPQGGGMPGGMTGGGLGGNAAIPSEITVKEGTIIKPSNGNIINVPANNKAAFTAQAVELIGNMQVADPGALTLTLTQSTLTGTITNTALTLGSGSKWNVTGDSSLASLSNAGGISGNTITNIYGNGHTVTYDPNQEENKALGGKTYSLQSGGKLIPTK